MNFQNPFYVISSPTVRLLIRATELLEDALVWEERPEGSETVDVELVNFKNVCRAELQHRGEKE